MVSCWCLQRSCLLFIFILPSPWRTKFNFFLSKRNFCPRWCATINRKTWLIAARHNLVYICGKHGGIECCCLSIAVLHRYACGQCWMFYRRDKCLGIWCLFINFVCWVLMGLVTCVTYINLKTAGERSFLFQAPNVWNSLPSEIRPSPSLLSFKHSLNTHSFRQTF